METQLAELKQRIAQLQVVYFALFGASLFMLVLRSSTLLWAVTLGSAVACRLYRTSLVNKYNGLLNEGRDGPLS